MAGQMGFWSITDRLAEISARGDPLETLAGTLDFEIFRPVLETALGRAPRWKGGRPPFDPVLKFRMLVLQSLHGLSQEQTEYLVRDRLSWMRFCQLGPEDRVPDANTLWDFREALIAASTYTSTPGRSVREARRGDHGGGVSAARGPDPRRDACRGRTAAQHRRREGPGQGGQVCRGDLAGQACEGTSEGRGWTLDGQVFQGEGPRRRHEAGRYRDPRLWLQVPYLHRPHARGRSPPDRYPLSGHCCAMPCRAVDASRHDGARLREGLITPTNTSRSVWADSAYRSAENEDWLEAHDMASRIHRKKPRGRPMPKRTRRANAARSAVRSKVEHVFAQQKARMGMTIRTIGLARARATITLANMVYNMTRWRWLDSRTASA